MSRYDYAYIYARDRGASDAIAGTFALWVAPIDRPIADLWATFLSL